LEALAAALTRPTDALLPKKNKRRLIIDLASTDPAHGKRVLSKVLFSARWLKHSWKIMLTLMMIDNSAPKEENGRPVLTSVKEVPQTVF
jgi:hypothetical protein